MTITKENLTQDPEREGTYETTFTYKEDNIEIAIDPDDVDLEVTIALANKVLANFEDYEAQARKMIIKEFLEDYNENWRDEEDGEPELDEEGFYKELTLYAINFLSDSSIDFFYNENGLMGEHSLIAQSFDGETFEDATMYG